MTRKYTADQIDSLRNIDTILEDAMTALAEIKNIARAVDNDVMFAEALRARIAVSSALIAIRES